MQFYEYQKKIVACVHKLKVAGSEIIDELVAAFMIAGLMEERQCKLRLYQDETLQENQKFNGGNGEKASSFIHRRFTGNTRKCCCKCSKGNEGPSKVRCFDCGKEGHYAENCKQKNCTEKDGNFGQFVNLRTL